VDEHNWDARVNYLEREGLDLLGVVTTAATWSGQLAGPVRRIVDVGSGPGVGTCELARCFPDAQVVAVDASRPMLERVVERSRSLGFGDRISTRLAELPNGLEGLGSADIVFASMSLHHMPNPDQALASIRRLVTDGGLIVVIEHGPSAAYGHAPTIDALALLAASGFDVIGGRVSSGRAIIIGRPESGNPRLP
jgi:ubiquinone/menaquinone biosynthesis C-methylase UbiE